MDRLTDRPRARWPDERAPTARRTMRAEAAINSLAVRILLGLAAGAVLGALLQGRADDALYWVAQPVGAAFMRVLVLFMLPLATSALVLGVLGLEPARLARVGARILALTVGLSGSAIAIGLAAVWLVKPGAGVDPATLPVAKAAGGHALTGLLAQFPDASPMLMPALLLSLGFALAMRATDTPAKAPLEAWIQGVFDVSAKAVHLILALAPIGVAALTFQTTARGGLAALQPLGWFVGTVLSALAVQMFVVYPLVLKAAGRDPLAFFRGAEPALTMAFSTASSAATLPTSLDVAEQRLGIEPETARFVLTVGATGNQNGTALFEGIAVLFLAQMYGVQLTLAQQAGVIGVAMIGGVGTAGVPGGALPVITGVVVSLGLPDTAVGVIVGVDRLLDMARTTLNVTGDLVIAAVVAPDERQAAGKVTSNETPPDQGALQ